MHHIATRCEIVRKLSSGEDRIRTCEPGFPGHRFSKPAHSTTLPPLLKGRGGQADPAVVRPILCHFARFARSPQGSSHTPRATTNDARLSPSIAIWPNPHDSPNSSPADSSPHPRRPHFLLRTLSAKPETFPLLLATDFAILNIRSHFACLKNQRSPAPRISLDWSLQRPFCPAQKSSMSPNIVATKATKVPRRKLLNKGF